MSRSNPTTISNARERPVSMQIPEMVIGGVPMEVISVIEDGHGVSWVTVEPARRRMLRIRTAIRAKVERIER
jgi:hypothetical protein